VSQGLVTPEAVVLQFETAGVGSRLVAGAIDTVIQAVVLVALLAGAVFVGHLVHPLGLAGVYLSLFAVVFGYPIGLETLWRGRTVGKAALGLRVVTVEGGPIHFRHAAVRGLLAIVDVYLLSGAVAVIAILLSPKNQRLGDMAAGTLMIRERTGVAPPTPTTFTIPPEWEPYAATLDVAGLTPGDYSAVRAFLLRAPSLAADRRHDLAVRLATPMLARLRHTPPAEVSPEALLACIAARYQRRQRAGVAGPASPDARPDTTPLRPATAAPPTAPRDGFAPPA
jgi:uncharacterized RDD family membrane protein YckC